MNLMTRLSLAVLAALLPTSLLADAIVFNDDRSAVSDEKIRIIGDCMKRIAWEEKGTTNRDNAFPWEVNSYTLLRLKRAPKESVKIENAFVDAWNKVMRSGVRGTWPKIEELYQSAMDARTKLDELKLQGYDDLEHMKMRILYFRLRAAAELGQDIQACWDEYVAANIAYADVMSKDRSLTTSRPVQGGPFNGKDSGALHATTYDAFLAVALYYRNKGDVTSAFDNGYRPASMLAEELRRGTNKTEYISKYAITALTEAAGMFEGAETPDWDSAAKVYKDLRTLMITLSDPVGANRMEMAEARCRVNLGDTVTAKGVYKRATDEYEKMNEEGAPDRNWLTEDRARMYAAAYTGLGLVARADNRDFEALSFFVKSLALFSTDREERAEALLQAGLTSAALAKKQPASAVYYHASGTSYMIELSNTYKDTRAASRASDLAAQLAAVKPAQ